MNKTLIIVTDRSTLRETIYQDVTDVEIIYSGNTPMEFIVTDQSGVRHHFPTEHYSYEMYKQINEHLNTKVRIPDDTKSMFNNYKPKFYLNRGNKHE